MPRQADSQGPWTVTAGLRPKGLSERGLLEVSLCANLVRNGFFVEEGQHSHDRSEIRSSKKGTAFAGWLLRSCKASQDGCIYSTGYFTTAAYPSLDSCTITVHNNSMNSLAIEVRGSC